MLTVKDTKQLGWTLTVDGENGTATHEDGSTFHVTSGTPLFSMLLEIAERAELEPPERTAAAVKKATGETYEEPQLTGDRLDRARARVQDAITATLASTDRWAARAYEDGAPMSDARKAYRQALRAAYQQISTSDDPESVTLPEPPAAE